MDFAQKIKIVEEIARENFSNRRERFSIAALERYLNVAQNMWRYWRNGGRPRLEDAEKISRGLGISPRWLLLGEGEPLDKGQARAGSRRSDWIQRPEDAGRDRIAAPVTPEELARELVHILTTRNPVDVHVDLVDTRRGKLEISFTRKPEQGYPVSGDEVRDGRPARVQETPPGPDPPPEDDDLPTSAAVRS